MSDRQLSKGKTAYDDKALEGMIPTLEQAKDRIRRYMLDGKMLPHEFLLRVVRGEEIDGYKPTFHDRMFAAKSAAPYFAPKLASIVVDADIKGGVNITISADESKF